MRTKNWICLNCHRDGEKLEMEDAKREHREQLLATKQMNERNRHTHGRGAIGPSHVCAGNIVLSSKRSSLTPPVRESGDLGGTDPWLARS